MDLLHFETVQQGLRELVDSAYSFRQNMDARIATPVLEDGTDLWADWLDSRTMNLYGGVNEDGRHRFKIDHEFDLSKIIDSQLNPDGSISLDEQTYTQSQGREFIIIPKSDIKDAKTDYAIRADKYESVKDQLSEGIAEDALKESGGFKINIRLKPEEIPAHDRWLELAVGRNDAADSDYKSAAKFLENDYVPKARKRDCFPDGAGMGFFVQIDVQDYKVRPWCVGSSGNWSYADGRGDFGIDGRFLRVLDKSAAGAAQKPAYDAALKLILEVPIRNDAEAAALSGLVTTYRQAKR